MPKATELYTLVDAEVIGFTDKAVLVTREGEDYWLPFSQIHEPPSLDIRASRGQTIDIVISAWLAKEKGII